MTLRTFCDQSSVDIIPLGFINAFPAQADGLVGENFANACWGNPVYAGPGYPGVNGGKPDPTADVLPQRCRDLQEDLYYCQQKKGKKFLLSLGGASTGYQLTGEKDGEYLADFLWKSYILSDPVNGGARGSRRLARGLEPG